MYKGKHVRRRRWVTLLRWLGIIAAVVLVLWPWVEPYTLEVDQHELISNDLPEEIRQLRVVYLSDIHQGGFPWFTQSRTNDLVAQIKRLKPDLVVFGGDYANDPEGAIRFFENLPKFSATYGIYAVVGEHDRAEEDANDELLETLRKAMKAKNVTLLDNAVERFMGLQNVYIAGLDDYTNGHPALNTISGQVSSSDFVILACHNPAMIDDLSRSALSSDGKSNWFDLGLFGHTHGGQLPGSMNLLGIGSDVEQARHREGWIEESRSTPMLISRGIGTSVLPIRILCSPQIHLIVIRRSQQPGRT
ncbi:MAG: metallophosphoesterase family protein [Clostridia bacterium]|nr:metallophosphoesterase family protein [Clostridia bacterium]MBR4457797.1 metallophosphoesterase family protein [Clostridia bacterium]